MVYRSTLRREGGGQDPRQRLHQWVSHGLLCGWIPGFGPLAAVKPDLQLRGPTFPVRTVKEDLYRELVSRKIICPQFSQAPVALLS